MSVDLQLRRTGIGGSDVAAILGLSKYRTPLDVYLQKRGLVEDSGDDARMEMGRYMEPAILQWYRDSQQVGIADHPLFGRHPLHDWLLFNLDGVVQNEHGDEWIVDSKNTHWRLAADWGEDGSDEIPNDALFQGHHYLFLNPWAAKCDFVVVKGGTWPPRIYTVQRDAEMYDVVLPRLKSFWFDHVQKGIPPAPDFADEKTLAALKALYPASPEKELEIALAPVVEVGGKLVRVCELAEAYDYLGQQEKKLGSARKKIEAALRAVLADSKAGIVDEIVIKKIFNKGGFRKAQTIEPYDYLKVSIPESWERKVGAARALALIGEGESNG